MGNYCILSVGSVTVMWGWLSIHAPISKFIHHVIWFMIFFFFFVTSDVTRLWVCMYIFFWFTEARGTGPEMVKVFKGHSKKSLKIGEMIQNHLGNIAETYMKSKEKWRLDILLPKHSYVCVSRLWCNQYMYVIIRVYASYCMITLYNRSMYLLMVFCGISRNIHE